ncbi:MAG: hypothetical protein J6S53_04240 [Lentisphaeria bacterium]|nr:hypothetical protein [Lentisphaeria bacterium]
MKKLFIAVLLASLAMLSYAAPATAKTPEKVILPGALTISVPAKPPKTLIGKEWVSPWGLIGHAGIENGKIFFKNNATIYNFYIPVAKEPKKYILTVKCAALADAKKTGLNGYFSTCVRKVGDKRPFNHEKRTPFGPFAVTTAEKEYTVEYTAEAFERGYIYLSGTNIVISSIRLVAVAPAAK